MDTHIDAALAFAGMGFRMVPCHSISAGNCSCQRRSKCTSAGKHPRPTNWPEKATSDTAKIKRWWKQWPTANVGVATGAQSGIVVFDFDGCDGERTLNKLAHDVPSILETRVHRSGSGGTHLFYQHPGWHVGNAVRRLPGMDIRGDNGLIIVPPSNRTSNVCYSVQNESAISVIPESLMSLLNQCHKEDDENEEDIENERVMKSIKQGLEEKKGSLLIAKREQIQLALKESLPTGQGRRNRQVFALARRLLAVDGISQQIPAVEFRSIVQRWYKMAQQTASRLNFTIDSEFEETWSDFTYCWGKVRYPVGASLRPVFDHVVRMDAEGEIDPLAWNALAYFGRTENGPQRLLISVLMELAKRAGGKPFSLACTAGAAEFTRLGFEKVDNKWILRRLGTLVVEKILHCVDPGKAGPKGVGKPAMYLWTWTMKEIPSGDDGDSTDFEL